jgi:hypothetical protein
MRHAHRRRRAKLFAAELRRGLAALELPGARVLGRGERLEWTAGRCASLGGVS